MEHADSSEILTAGGYHREKIYPTVSFLTGREENNTFPPVQICMCVAKPNMDGWMVDGQMDGIVLLPLSSSCWSGSEWDQDSFKAPSTGWPWALTSQWAGRVKREFPYIDQYSVQGWANTHQITKYPSNEHVKIKYKILISMTDTQLRKSLLDFPL